MPLGFTRTAFITLKTAILAPIPNASVRIAVMLNAAFFRSNRAEYRAVLNRRAIMDNSVFSTSRPGGAV
jgi:hypothetical protein